MERELINGQMEEYTLDNGRIIKCQVKAYSFGLMAENIKVIISMTRNKDLASSNGLTEENTKAIGLMASSMEAGYSIHLIIRKSKDNGRMIRK